MLFLSWLLFSFLVFIFIIILSYLYQIKRMKQFKPFNGPLVLPIIGNIWHFYGKNQSLHDKILGAFNEYGNIIHIYVGPFKHIVCTADPKVAEKIMSSPKANFKTSFYNLLRPWLGDGLITVNGGEKWRKRRKLSNHVFHLPSYMEQYVNTFNNFSKLLIEQLLDNYKSDDEINIYNLLTLCALDIICDTAMGIKVNAQTKTNSEYIQNVRKMCLSIFKRAISPVEQSDFIFNHFTKNGKNFNCYLKVIHSMTDKVIQERRKVLLEQLDENANVIVDKDELGRTKYNTFLDMLLQESVDGQFLNDIDIRDEVATILFAGHDTVSYSVSFVLYLLAIHPQIQDKVLQEVREILGDDKNRMPTLSELNKMKYMDLVCKETLRLYPPVPFIGRKLSEKFVLDDVSLPANTECMIFINGIHQNEQCYPNPQQFVPERFLDKNLEKMAFLPFGSGQRKCLGFKYAWFEMKALIANLITNFECIPISSEYKPQILLGIVSKPRGGVRIKVRRRT